MTENSHVSTRHKIQLLTNQKGQIWYGQNKTQYVFHLFDIVNKFNLETQNPSSDTNIPCVSAGLGKGGAMYNVQCDHPR